jgi:hypothetical protein
MTGTVTGSRLAGNRECCCKTGRDVWRYSGRGLVLCRVYLQQVAVSSNVWIIINNEMGVMCNKGAVAYFNALPRYLTVRDSEKPQKYSVNRVFVPLKYRTAHSRMQFGSYFITFDFYGHFSNMIHLVKYWAGLNWLKI